MTRELGGSIGTAWMSNALTNNTAQYVNSLSSHVTVYSDITRSQLHMMEGIGRSSANPEAVGLAMLNMAYRRASYDRFVQYRFHESRSGLSLCLQPGLLSEEAKTRASKSRWGTKAQPQAVAHL